MTFGQGIRNLLLAGIVITAFAVPALATADRSRVWLEDGAPSVDDLVHRFLAAIEGKDKAAIHRLRVTEEEYRQLILPGSVDPGKPLVQYKDDDSQYFWSMLDTKSMYYENNLLASWGGKSLKLKKIAYRGGEKQYADYKAYKSLILTLENEKGEEEEMEIGSIAEVDGRHKFISFVRK